MHVDWFSSLNNQQRPTVEEIIQLEKERKNKNNKEEKQEKLLKSLLLNAHMSYQHFVAIKEKTLADRLRTIWQKENLRYDASENLTQWKLEKFFQDNFLHHTIDISLLPPYSFLLQFEFILEKPYISRGEEEFYIIDNPVRKDKVFGLPFIAPSSWKGSLRSALWQLGYKPEKLKHILGNEKMIEEQEGIQAGRMHFFPTFFLRKSLEVINPHNREQKVGKNPILLESVPEDTSGIFTLLYVPFDLIGKDSDDIKRQAIDDLELIITGIYKMFRVYGFGAKTASGYGLAKSNLKKEGQIFLKAKGIKLNKQKEIKLQAPEESFSKYLNKNSGIKEEFTGSGNAGLLSNSEYRVKGEELGGGSLSEFKRFRQWYNFFGEQWQKYVQGQNTPEPVSPIGTFNCFEELRELAEKITKLFQQNEEDVQ